MTRPTVALPDVDAPYLGRGRVTWGQCEGGLEGRYHAGGRCGVMSWSPDPGGWRACPCACHDVDLEDAELVRQVIAEAAPRELAWRVAASAGSRRRRAG